MKDRGSKSGPGTIQNHPHPASSGPDNQTAPVSSLPSPPQAEAQRAAPTPAACVLRSGLTMGPGLQFRAPKAGPQEDSCVSPGLGAGAAWQKPALLLPCKRLALSLREEGGSI